MAIFEKLLGPILHADKGERYPLLLAFGLCNAVIFVGFDAGVLSIMFGDASFVEEYNMTSDRQGDFSVTVWPTTVLSTLVLAPILSKYVGRRELFLSGAVILTIGAVLMTIGHTSAMLFVGRAIVGIGTGFLQLAYTNWVAECSSTKFRGFALSFQQIAYNFGVFISFWIGLGTANLGPRKGWRAVSACQCFFALIVIPLALFVPESPRQLLVLSKDPLDEADPKVQRARKSLARLRCRSIDDPEVVQEFNEMAASESYKRTHKLDLSYSALFKSPGFYRRWFFGALSYGGAQFGGVSALLVFGVVVFQSIGFDDHMTSLLINGVGGSLQLVAGIFPMLYSDRFGRRGFMLLGLGGNEIALIFLAALLNRWPDAQNEGASIVCIIAIYLVYVSYSGGSGFAGTSYSVEIWDTHIRPFGYGCCTLFQAGVIIAFQKGFPIMISTIGPKSYYVFLGMNSIILVLVIFLWPETAGVTVESMNKLFGEIDVLEEVKKDLRIQEEESIVLNEKSKV